MNETLSRTIPQPKTETGEGAAAFSGKLDHPMSRYYVFNDFYNMEPDDTLHILPRFRTYQQTTEYTCGAASALMVLERFGQHRYHERLMEQLMDSHCTRGTTVENLADFFDLIGWQVDYHACVERRFDTPADFEAYAIDCIDRGIPMMIDWVDWAGHWQVLMGIDTCGTDDPYDDADHFQDGYYTFPLGRFFGMWREGPCADKTQAYQQPFVAAWPKE